MIENIMNEKNNLINGNDLKSKDIFWDIKIENLTAGYGEDDIIKSLSAIIPSGKITAILGGSGGGKTTLLRVILGLLPYKSGKIFFGNKDIFSLSAKQFRSLRRRVGVLFQDGALLSSLTLEENVALPLKEHTTLDSKIIKEAVLHTLELVGLENSAHKYPGELSGGMKKRAGLARAIITEPPLLFYDEPTSGLDPITAAEMDNLLLEMQACYQNMTTVVITHDLVSVKRVADHVLLLKDGKNHYNGEIEGFFNSNDAYIQEFTNKALVEKNKKNFIGTNEKIRKALNDWIDS